MKYIFINQTSNERGGITTLAEHFLKFEPNSIILNLNAEATELGDPRQKYVSAEVSHQPAEVGRMIESMVRPFPSENFLLIPNYGQVAHAAAALALARNRNCRILGIGHTNQESSYEILRSFSPVISQYLAVSKWVLGELAAKVGDKKITHLYPLTTKSPCVSGPNEGGTLRLIFVSRLTNVDKEALRLIPFMEKLAEIELKFSLDIYGDGPCRPEIQAYLDSLQLANASVTMHGNQPQQLVEKAFSQGDVFVSLAGKEGFGMAIAEAMSARMAPLVMRFDGGICELLQDGEDSILVEQEDFAGLTATLVELDRDRKLLERIKDNARRKIMAFQDEEYFFRSFLEIANGCFREKHPEVALGEVTSMDPMNNSLAKIVDKVRKRKPDKVNVFGGGLFGRRVIDGIREFGIEIGCIYDSSIGNSEKSYDGIEYLPPAQLVDDNPIVVCSIESSAEIVNFLSGMKVDPSRIIAL